MKKRWVFVSLVVGALTLGVMGGTILAQGAEEEEGKSPVKSFAARVAGILGLEQEAVETAFEQAKREMQDERLESRLDKALENGLIDEARKAEILKWYKDRPAGMKRGFLGQKGHGFQRGGKGGRMGRGKGFRGGRGFGRGFNRQPPTAPPAEVPIGDQA